MTTIIENILEDSPAAQRADFIPPASPFPPLTELYEEHQATLADLREFNAEYHALLASYQLEDDQALEATRVAYAEGKDPKPGKRTPNTTRELKLAEMKDRGQIIQEHLREVLSDVVTTVQTNLDEWTATLAEGEAEAQRRVHDLREQLQQAEGEAAQSPDLRTWLERVGTGKPPMFLYWGWFVNEKPTTSLLQIANEGRSAFNSRPSQALAQEQDLRGGGEAVDVNHIPDYAEEVTDYSSQQYQESLSQELKDHIRKRQPNEAAPGAM
jgi:hypothetical protein